MIITISGTPGAGKTIIGKNLAKKLNYKFYSMGDIRGMMAKERGMTIDQLNKVGEKEAFTDKDADDYQVKLGKTEDNFVIDGRLSYYFIPNSLKIYMTADEDMSAKRIMNDTLSDRSDEQRAKTLEEQKEILRKRIISDKLRYKKYYGLDFTKKDQFDFILDTSLENDIEKNTQKVLDFLKNKGLLKQTDNEVNP